MKSFAIPHSLDRSVFAVWVAMLGLGCAAWLGSDTPVAGASVILAVLLAAASPTGALYATCAAIPFIFHPITIGNLELGLLELGILATALGSAFRFLYDRVSGRHWELRQVVVPWFPLVAGVLLLIIGSLSLVWMPFSLHRAEALRTWRWVIVEPLIAFGLARLAISRDGRAPLALAVAIPAGVVALVAIRQSIDATSSFSVDDVHRSTATYLHPNNLALYLERAFFLLFAPALFARGRVRWPLAGIGVVIALAIGVTFSRGALLGLAAGGAVLLLAHPIRHGWKLLGGGLATVLAAFALVSSERLTGSDSSGVFSTRRFLWSDALEMVRDFPIRGIGLDQFLWLHQQRYIDPRIWSERYVSHPHNLVLDSWLSLGLPGLGLLVVFICAGAWLIWKSHRGALTLDPWQLGAISSVAAGLGHGMVDNGYFLPDIAVMTWLSVALLTTRTRRLAHDIDGL